MSDGVINVRELVAEEVARQLPSLVPRTVTASPWMTETEAAEYLRIFNKDGEVTVHSIRKWTARDSNPLPCGMAGEMRRYHREDLDRWMRDEAERNRARPKKNYPRAVNE